MANFWSTLIVFAISPCASPSLLVILILLVSSSPISSGALLGLSDTSIGGGAASLDPISVGGVVGGLGVDADIVGRVWGGRCVSDVGLSATVGVLELDADVVGLVLVSNGVGPLAVGVVTLLLLLLLSSDFSSSPAPSSFSICSLTSFASTR